MSVVLASVVGCWQTLSLVVTVSFVHQQCRGKRTMSFVGKHLSFVPTVSVVHHTCRSTRTMSFVRKHMPLALTHSPVVDPTLR